MHYLCRRCNHNAVPGNIPDQICEDCEHKRCHCPGCSACGCNENGCTKNGTHISNPQTWCSSCKNSWTCSQCGGQASASTKPPTGPVCYDCSQGEDLALDSFAQRNCLEYFYLGQEDEVMLEWFEKACADFQALSDFTNAIGQAPTQEAQKHLRDAALTIDDRATVGFI